MIVRLLRLIHFNSNRRKYQVHWRDKDEEEGEKGREKNLTLPCQGHSSTQGVWNFCKFLCFLMFKFHSQGWFLVFSSFFAFLLKKSSIYFGLTPVICQMKGFFLLVPEKFLQCFACFWDQTDFSNSLTGLDPWK